MSTFGRASAAILVLFSLAVCVIAARDLTETSTTSVLNLPAALKVPAGSKLQEVLYAEGHQYYRFNGTSWVNYNASAVLYNAMTQKVGRHVYLTRPDALGGEPTWQTLPSDGVPHSRVTGKAATRVTVYKNSIAWVLLKATQSNGDKKYFGAAAYIVRFNTKHGLPPRSKGLDGRIRKSRYSAEYAFYVRV